MHQAFLGGTDLLMDLWLRLAQLPFSICAFGICDLLFLIGLCIIYLSKYLVLLHVLDIQGRW
jgi:hypothetical protein